MARRDDAKKELEALVEEARKLIKEFMEADEEYPFHWEYQNWYSKALRAVQILAPDRYEEFRHYYEIDPKRKSLGYGTYVIQDFLKGIAPSSLKYPDFDTKRQVIQCLYNQLTILNGLVARVDSVLADVEGELYAELKDAEINTAKSLIRVSPRAAGALAAVVLEGYLQKVCANHGIKFRKKAPTISDFNNALKNAKVYGTPTWRKVSYLGDLRNLCTHKKQDTPSRDQVNELIGGVEWATKNIF